MIRLLAVFCLSMSLATSACAETCNKELRGIKVGMSRSTATFILESQGLIFIGEHQQRLTFSNKEKWPPADWVPKTKAEKHAFKKSKFRGIHNVKWPDSAPPRPEKNR